MRWIAKTLAALTVFSWIVVAGLFARPVAAPAEASDARRLGRSVRTDLPTDWAQRLLRDCPAAFPGVDPGRVRDVTRLAERYGRRFDVDPLTILAVIQVESRFDPQALSSKGAMGLMQLQAETARELAMDLGLPWTGDDLLFDPDINILLGTCYLRRLIDRFGTVDAALAAYCSGPTLVETILGGDGRIPLGYSDRVWDVLTALHARAAA